MAGVPANIAGPDGQTPQVNEHPAIRWIEAGTERSARWRSEKGTSAHKRVVIADELMTADAAYRLACEGMALLWRGDFQNARQMLQAMARRADEKKRRARKSAPSATPPSTARVPDAGDIPKLTSVAFHRHRLAQAQRARTLGMLLLPLTGDYRIPLRRAPDLQHAIEEAYGPPSSDPPEGDSLVSMREVLGLIGAHEWRKNGVDVLSLKGRIHPHYGVFAPVRGEYVGLLADAPLPSPVNSPSCTDCNASAFDVGTGTGVLAAVLARRGLEKIIATDMDPRALACARDNFARLEVAPQVELVQADLFPDGRAPLIVCNPPWIPARPSSPLENAIFDPDSRMLRGFLSGLATHLVPGGEGWLILSDIAEHLGLRTRAQLLAYFEQGGLAVIDRLDARPSHPRVFDSLDPLHAARAAEVTSLWRLRAV